MVSYSFHGGKYAGKTLEEVALKDYSYLVYAKKTLTTAYEGFKKRIDEIIQILNNFNSVEKCEKCKETAKNISTAYSYAYTYGNCTIDPSSYSIKSSHFYCDKKECLDSINTSSGVKIVPIKFDSILEYDCSPKYLRREMQKLLLKAAGWQEKRKITKKSAREFIDKLL
jgi:hypothetical protein